MDKKALQSAYLTSLNRWTRATGMEPCRENAEAFRMTCALAALAALRGGGQ